MAKYRPPSMMSASKFDNSVQSVIRKELESLISCVDSATSFSVQSNAISRELLRLNQIIHNKHSLQDVLTIIKLLGELPYSALSSDDFACIARFVTRTSKEKQLPIFQSPDIRGLCVLLVLFLKYKGCGCRVGSGPDVMHEVLRGVAQLILLSPHAMETYRVEIIRIFLFYSRDATPDAMNLVPALDGLCNLFLTFDRHALSPVEAQVLPSVDAVAVADENTDNINKNSTRLLEECVELGLLFNLRNALVRFHESPDPTQRCRWLVSGLRALTAALTLASATKQTTSDNITSTPNKLSSSSGPSAGFSLSVGSALNALNNSVTLFGGILGRVDISETSGSSCSQCPLDVRVKLWKHAIRFLSALSTYNSAAEMKTWLLHLGDSLVIDARWKALLKVDIIGSYDSVRVGQFRSHLFRCASSSPHIAIRSAAVECMHAMLDRPSLRKVVVLAMRLDKNVGGALQSSSQTGSESNASLVLKVFKVAAMALSTERSEEVVLQLLRIVTLFVDNMPLRSACSVGEVLQGGHQSRGGGVQSELEGIAGVLFRGVMVIAAERQTPSTSGNLAIVWLEQHCKAPVTSQAFAAALEMNYRPLADTVTPAISNAQNINFSPVKNDGRSSATSDSNWRNKNIVPQTIESSATQRSSPVPIETSIPHSPFNFLSAVVDICSTGSRGVSGISNAQSVVTRSLCCQLVGGYPRLRGDGQWLGAVMDSYASSDAPALRVQSCRMVTALLGGDNTEIFYPTEIVNNFDTAMLAARRLQTTLLALLSACGETEHLVRAAAVGSLGALSAKCWTALRQLPASRLEIQTDLSIAPSSIQAALVRTVLKNSADLVSTVRAASFKALGDIVLTKGLGGDNSSSDSDMIGSLFMATTASKSGCGDSSLAVRTQAAWALSNILQSVLPLRFEHLGRLLVVQDREVDSYSWLHDEAWRKLFDLIMHVLTVDSEKLSATAVRTLGILVGGLSPRLASHRDFLDCYYRALRDRYLSGEVSADVQALENQSQKLAFAVSQSLGFLLWGQLKDNTDGDQERINEIVTVQVAMLRHGKPALQLQAAQILLFFVSSLGVTDSPTPPDSLFHILETVLLVGTIPHKVLSSNRTRKTQLEGLVAADVTADEANRLLESRVGFLQRYLLVLLWSVTRLATVSYRTHVKGAAFREQVLGQLDDQSRGLMDWLERLRLTGSSRCQLQTDLLLGLPHIAYSRYCSLLKPLDGKSYSVIVSETAAGVLDLLQLVERAADAFSPTEYLLATSVSRLESLRDGLSRPAAAERWGGYGVFSGLEPILSPRVTVPREEDQDEI